MTDEVFRKEFSDDIFRSMKAQMEPSDDTIASLLAKIAAETPSSATETDNVIPFRRPAEVTAETTAAAVESAPRRHFAKKANNKSIWYYGTAVAASIIVMISTFTLLGVDDNSNVKDLFNQAVGSNTQIADQDHQGTETQNPDVSGTDNPDVIDTPDMESSDSEEGSQPDQSADRDSEKENPADTDEMDGQQPVDKNSDKTPGKESSGKDEPNSGSQEGSGSSQTPDNGKVTPGEEGTGEIAWTNEIVSTSQVASITISGSNYVVENTISRDDISTTLETVTIEIPQTSSTNAVQLKAKVREVKNVSSAAMVALDVEGFADPLVYANPDYAPASLGDVVADLGLENKISFAKTVRGQISRMGYTSNHSYSKDIYSAVWQYLLNQSSAPKADYESFTAGASKLLFTSDSNPTGVQMQFGVSDNGYLYVNMLGTKYTFHIGTENAKGFIEYVTGEAL